MNEELLQAMYNQTGMSDAGVSKEDYAKLLMDNADLRSATYSEMGFKDQGVTQDDFEGLLGLKKKAQEDTESVSEAGSSGLQEWGDEGVRSVRQEPTQPEDFQLEVSEQTQETVRPTEELRGVETVESIKEKEGTLLDAPLTAYADYLKEENPTLFKQDIEMSLAAERGKEIDALADTFTQDQRKALQEKHKDLGEEGALIAANQDIYEGARDLALGSIGLNEEESAQFGKAITAAADGRRKFGLLKAELQKEKDPKLKAEIVSQMKELSELNKKNDEFISSLRENADKAFADAEGNVNQELKADVENRTAKFGQEYKSDYNKILDRMIKEQSKMSSLKKEFLSKLTPEQYLAIGGDELAESNLNRLFDQGFADRLKYFLPGDSSSEDAGKMNSRAASYMDAYKEADKNFQALSRLTLLNEDPAAVERGWGSFVDAIPSALKGTIVEDFAKGAEALGQTVTSAGETLWEARTGTDYASDKDFRELAVGIAKEEGLNLTPEQIAAGETQFSEKLGDALGISADIGIDIMATRNMIGGASKLVNLPKHLAKINKLRESPKLVKFIDGLGEVLMEGAAFELASDKTDFWMGAAEGTSSKAMDALVSKIAGSKYGKFFKFLDNYAGRMAKEVTGRTVGGVVEEYTGDFVSEGVKNGFFTEEQFKNVFGEGEEGLEKFFLTLGSVGMMTVPTSIVTAAKKKAEGEPEGELAKAIERYESAQKVEPTKEEVKGGLETLEKADSEVVKDLSEEEKQILTKDLDPRELEKDDTQEGQPVPSTEQTGKEPGDLQVDEESKEEAAASGVLQAEEIDSYISDFKSSLPSNVVFPSKKEAEARESLRGMTKKQVEDYKRITGAIPFGMKPEVVEEFNTTASKWDSFSNSEKAEFLKRKDLGDFKGADFFLKMDDLTTPSKLDFLPEEIVLTHLSKGEPSISKTSKKETSAYADSFLDGIYLSDSPEWNLGDEGRMPTYDSRTKVKLENKNGLFFDDSIKMEEWLQEQPDYDFDSSQNNYSSYNTEYLKSKGVDFVFNRSFDGGGNELIVINPSIIKDVSKTEPNKTKTYDVSYYNSLTNLPKKTSSVDYVNNTDNLKKVNEYTDTFSKEELDQEITRDNLQILHDKVDNIQKKIRESAFSDATGLVAAFDFTLELVKKGLKAGMTARDVFKKARQEFAKTDQFKNMSPEDKKAYTDIKTEEEFYGKLAEMEKAKKEPEVPTSVSKIPGDAYNKSKEVFETSKERMTEAEAVTEAFKTIERTDEYQNMSPEEQSEVEANFKNRVAEGFASVPKKKVSSKPKDTSAEVKTTEKKVLLERLRNQEKGAKAAVKGKAENQKLFIKDINESADYLNASQKKQARSLIADVKDGKSLQEARTQLSNLVEYGTKKPKTSNIVTKKAPEKKTELTQKQVTRLEYKAEQAGAKNLKQSEKEAVSYIKKKMQESGVKPNQIRVSELKKILTEFAKVDPSSKKFADFEKTVSSIMEKAAKRDVTKEVNRKLKSAARRLSQGKRKTLAKSLLDVDFNKVKDTDLYEQIVDGLYDSSRKRTMNVNELEIAIEKLKREQRDYQIEQFNDSPYADIMTFDEYEEAIANQKSGKTDEEILEAKLKKEESRKKFFDSIVERFNNVDTSKLNSREKKFYNTLKKVLNNKELYDKLGDQNIKNLFNSVEELYYLNSSAGLSKVTQELKGIEVASELKKWNDSIGGWISKGGRSFWTGMLNTTWDNFVNAIAKKTEYGIDFNAKLLSAWDAAFTRVQSIHNKIEQDLDAIANKLKPKQIQKVGVVADLLQHDSSLTEEEIQQDFENKIENLKYNIDVEKQIMENEVKLSPGYNAAKRRKKALEEALEIVDKYNTKQELQAVVDKGGILTGFERKAYDYVRKQADENLSDYTNSIYTHTGREIDPVTNYTPIYRKKLGDDVKELGKTNFTNSISAKESGRAKTRVKNIKNTYTNYDFIETAKNGLYEMISDIETLPEREQVRSTINSKEFKSMFAKQDKALDAINEYINDMAEARSTGKPSDSIKQNRVSGALMDAYSTIKATVLRGGLQYAKQITPLLGTVSQAGGKPVVQAINYMFSTNPEIQKRVEDAINLSQTKERTVRGDVNLKRAGASLAKRLLVAAKNPEGKGNKASRFYDVFSEESIGIADAFTAKTSYIANLIKVMKKEGRDFMKDPVTKEMAAKADSATNLMNNTSDYTKTKQAYQKGGSAKILRDLLFLYRSFAQNQSAVFYSSLPKIARGDADAAKLVGGQVASLLAFSAIGALTRDLVNSGAEALFGVSDEDLLALAFMGDDDMSDKINKELKRRAVQEDKDRGAGSEAVVSTLKDLGVGFMPSVLEDLTVAGINALAGSFGESESEAKFRKDLEKETLGFATEDQELIKTYGDKDIGALGIITGKPIGRALNIIQSDVIPDEYKKSAYIYLLGEIFQDNTLIRMGKNFLYDLEKADKALMKKVLK